MYHKDKLSKKRLNNSSSHFSLIKKSPSLSSATAFAPGLFKSPNAHHRSRANYMRKSQGPQVMSRYQKKEEEYIIRPDEKKDNQYGLIKDKTSKYEHSKTRNGKMSTFRSMDNFIKVETLSKITQDDQKNKITFRRMRSVRKSPCRRPQNPLKESCSTQNTHRHTQSPINPSREDLHQLSKVIETLSESALQYRNLYERSKCRLESIENQVNEEKTKYQRIKNIYKERINQLVRTKEFGKPNFGHLFTYQQFPKDFLPDSIIVQNSFDCSLSDATKNYELGLENCSKISNLSLESH